MGVIVALILLTLGWVKAEEANGGDLGVVNEWERTKSVCPTPDFVLLYQLVL
jgi:hypothetical protein